MVLFGHKPRFSSPNGSLRSRVWRPVCSSYIRRCGSRAGQAVVDIEVRIRRRKQLIKAYLLRTGSTREHTALAAATSVHSTVDAVAEVPRKKKRDIRRGQSRPSVHGKIRPRQAVVNFSANEKFSTSFCGWRLVKFSNADGVSLDCHSSDRGDQLAERLSGLMPATRWNATSWLPWTVGTWIRPLSGRKIRCRAMASEDRCRKTKFSATHRAL